MAGNICASASAQLAISQSRVCLPVFLCCAGWFQPLARMSLLP